MRTRSRDECGFILPMTLWVIAIIGLIAAVISEWVSQGVENALTVKSQAETELSFANIRNELAFAFARYPYSPRGLEVGERVQAPTTATLSDILNADFTSDLLIHLDGRAFALESNPDFIIKIQDGRGLINLNIVNNEYLGRLFTALDVDEDLHDLLTDTLLDYRDEDDLSRLSGAEARDYERLGMYPPSNYQLLSPWEAQRIIGWTQADAFWRRQYDHPIVTTCRSSGFNPNTAPPEVLATYIDGVTIDQTQALLDFREEMPFRNARSIGDAAGAIIRNQPFFFSFQPGRCFIIDLINKSTRDQIRFSLTLLPRNPSQPWQIDYVVRVPDRYRQQLATVSPGVSFPSPETISRRAGETDGTPRL